jgi:hypothetical protein
MAKFKKPRRMWTEDEKKELVREYLALPEGEGVKTQWLNSKGIGFGWMAQIKRKYANATAEPLTLAPASNTAPASEIAPFKDQPEAERRRLLVQYDALPKEEKTAFMQRYSVSNAMLVYWRAKLLKKAKKPTATSFDAENEAALVQEYLTLTGGGKSVWLKAHGLNHQTIFTMKQRVLARRANAKTNGHATSQELAHIPTRRVSKAVYTRVTEVPHAPEPERPIIHLQDGINYLTVKRDIYAEVIEDLKRVLAGAR